MNPQVLSLIGDVQRLQFFSRQHLVAVGVDIIRTRSGEVSSTTTCSEAGGGMQCSNCTVPTPISEQPRIAFAFDENPDTVINRMANTTDLLKVRHKKISQCLGQLHSGESASSLTRFMPGQPVPRTVR